MKALVFAAGLGTRLGPLTAQMPKALVPVGGEAMLGRVIRKLCFAGFRDIVVTACYKAGMVQDWLRENCPSGAMVAFSLEPGPEPFETGGGIKFARPLLEDGEPFLVHNVDILSDLDLRQLIAYHEKHEALATLAVRQRETSRYFLFDSDMNLCGWRNNKTGEEIRSKAADTYAPYAFSGIHIVRRELIDLIPSAEKQSITPIYVDLARNHKLKGFLHNEGHWKDMGKIEDFNS